MLELPWFTMMKVVFPMRCFSSIRMTKGCNDCSIVSSIAPGDSAQELCKTQNPDSRLYSKELILEIKNLNRRIVALELKEIRNSKSIVGRRWESLFIQVSRVTSKFVEIDVSLELRYTSILAFAEVGLFLDFDNYLR